MNLKIKNNAKNKMEYYEVTNNGSDFELCENISNLGVIYEFVASFRHKKHLDAFLEYIELDYNERFTKN